MPERRGPDPSAPPRVLLVPGFTQTAASWDAVVAALPADLDVVPLDVPTGLGFVETAHALGDSGGRGVYVGYSMGGRLTLRLALDRPEVVAGLVLVSASPGLAGARERVARRASDEALAREIESDGVDAFLARWLAQPLFAGVPPDAPGVAERRSFTAAQLATTLRDLGTGTQEPLWDRLGELAAPVVLVTGLLDAKFDTIAQAMLARLPAGARHERLPAGHALPLEAPDGLAVIVAAFAREVGV